MATEEDDLLQQANNGETEALRALLEIHGPRVCETIEHKIGAQWRSLVGAEDVMQVTYLEAFLQIDRLSAPNEATFIAWLRRIAENNLRDAIKELQRKKRPNPVNRVHAADNDRSYVDLVENLGMTTTTPSRHAARQEVRQIVDQIVDQLPADYATVVRLYDLQGRSIGDVAKEMGRSSGAIHMLRARAHDQLGQLMGRETNFFTRNA